MENSYDLNLICCNFIKHSERKTPNNRASESSVDNGIQLGTANARDRGVVDTLHEFQIQIFALVGIPLTGLGEFGIRLGSEPNDHVRLARLHEFSFDLVPSSTLSGTGSGRLQSSIQFALLSIG